MDFFKKKMAVGKSAKLMVETYRYKNLRKEQISIKPTPTFKYSPRKK